MRSRPRPRSVTWITVGVLIFSAANFSRLILSLNLPPLNLTVPQWYISLTGAFWGAFGLLAAYGLFFGKAWTQKGFLRLSLIYALWYWLDNLLYVKSDYVFGTRLISVALTIIVLGSIWRIMQRSVVKSYFMETTQ